MLLRTAGEDAQDWVERGTLSAYGSAARLGRIQVHISFRSLPGKREQGAQNSHI
jgi:hypothetical protein